jgi:cytochrome b561
MTLRNTPDRYGAVSMGLHWLTLAVLVLVVLRLVNRLAGAGPAVVPPLPLWQKRLASLVHLALYALMLAMPILGWLKLSAAGKPVPFFGLRLQEMPAVKVVIMPAPAAAVRTAANGHGL